MTVATNFKTKNLKKANLATSGGTTCCLGQEHSECSTPCRPKANRNAAERVPGGCWVVRSHAVFAAKKSALKMRYCSAQGAVKNISIATARVFCEQSYKALTSDGAPPFLCFCCFRAQKDEQVAMCC